MKNFLQKINPMDKEFKLVENKRHFFVVPVFILLFAVIIMFTFTVRGQNPLNLGMDFTGGYGFTVTYGRQLNDDNVQEKFDYLQHRVANFTDSGGVNHNIRLRNRFLRQGEGDTSSLLVRFDPVGLDDLTMYDLTRELREYLERNLFPDDPFGGRITQGAMMSGTISNELIRDAILGLTFALVGMLIYIGIRFKKFLPGLATVFALLHDVAIMFAFMAIFRIEMSATFIAVIITVVGYSINSNIILFDRVRENLRSPMLKDKPLGFVANLSVKETLTRTIITTFTTFLTISLIAIIGVPSVRDFMLPIIAGIIAGTFSTIFIVPGLWVTFENMWAKFKQKRAAKKGLTSAPKKKTEPATP